MRKKNLITLLLIASFVLVFGSWAAAGPDWKEEQAKWFSQIPVKPGDKIDTSNAEKVKDLFPPSMVKWVEKGDMTVDVGEVKYDLAADAEWKAASAKNEGKYDVDKTMEVIEKASGKHPTFVYGVPFPTIDCKNDPNAPVKIMHNAAANRYRCGTFYQEFADEWISRKGYERSLYGIYYGYFFWSRPDGPKPDPEGAEELVLCKVTEPEDLNGMNTLTKRFLDNRADDYYCYIPTIRRVKRMSGASRSDPFAGSEATIDDTNGWAGKNGSMKWKFLEQKVMLFPMATRTLQEPYQTTKQANGSW